MSLGAIDGIVLVALEDRFRTAVLLSGGFRFIRVPPEIEPINFAPRIKIPTLLLGGTVAVVVAPAISRASSNATSPTMRCLPPRQDTAGEPRDR